MKPTALATTNSYEERNLFLRTGEGDEQAFRELFLFYAHLLFPFLNNMLKEKWLAEEVIQETMLRVWLHREQLPVIENPRAWVFRIASNLALTQLQKKLSEEKYRVAQQNREEEVEPEAERVYSFKQLQRFIGEAVRTLPEKRGLIYRLAREEGLSRGEIAKRLGVSEKTVKNSMNAALKFIRAYLEKKGYRVFLCLLFLVEK